MGELVIYIDPQKAQDLDQNLALQKLYYRPEGYYQIAEKMLTACKRARYGFTLTVIKNWLNKQALYQIHKPRPKYIPQASFIILLYLWKLFKLIYAICLMIKLEIKLINLHLIV